EANELPVKPAIALRAVQPADAPAITALREEASIRQGTMALPFSRIADSEAFLARLTANDHMIVAEIGAAIVGAASLRRQAGRRSHAATLGIMVAEARQRQGVGTAMLGALVDLADRWLDLKRLELTVFTDNEQAIALYRKFGFEIEGRLRGYAFRDGAYADAYTMARLNFTLSLAPASG
ncbi:MAG TPA: GNAT family N-acetyltransferase, partial [Acetobacteraceae bacterium]|nr:GNAT family N-acetyltransferase [Acetobacteraceae bacterium]